MKRVEKSFSPVNAAVKSLPVFCSGKTGSLEIFLRCTMKIKLCAWNSTCHCKWHTFKKVTGLMKKLPEPDFL